MKFVLALTVLMFGSQAFAGWTEKVQCTVERLSVDSGELTKDQSTVDLYMQGPHNGETGVAYIDSKLTPSYSLKFWKLSGGRNEVVALTTYLGKDIIAQASGDTQFDKTISNRFVTVSSDYQFTVSCQSLGIEGN